MMKYWFQSSSPSSAAGSAHHSPSRFAANATSSEKNNQTYQTPPRGLPPAPSRVWHSPSRSAPPSYHRSSSFSSSRKKKSLAAGAAGAPPHRYHCWARLWNIFVTFVLVFCIGSNVYILHCMNRNAENTNTVTDTTNIKEEWLWNAFTTASFASYLPNNGQQKENSKKGNLKGGAGSGGGNNKEDTYHTILVDGDAAKVQQVERTRTEPPEPKEAAADTDANPVKKLEEQRRQEQQQQKMAEQQVVVASEDKTAVARRAEEKKKEETTSAAAAAKEATSTAAKEKKESGKVPAGEAAKSVAASKENTAAPKTEEKKKTATTSTKATAAAAKTTSEEPSKIVAAATGKTTTNKTTTAGIGHPAPPPKVVATTKIVEPASSKTTTTTTTTTNTTDTSHLHFVTRALMEGKKIFIYQRNQMTGFGSVLLTFLTFSIYFEEHHGRFVSVFDDTISQTYRKSKQVGLQGFLDFEFPVLNTPQEYTRIFEELQQVGLGHLANEEAWLENMRTESTTKEYPILRIRQDKDASYFQEKRNEVFQLYKYGGNDPLMFKRLSQRVCDNVTFSDELLKDIRAALKAASVPDFADSKSLYALVQGHDKDAGSSSTSTARKLSPSKTKRDLGPTVAFHVRRGDKVHGKSSESKLYLEDIYVDKMLAIPNIVPQDLRHCYVATDEYNVTVGLKESLLRHNVTCQLHYLVPRDRNHDSLSDRKSQEHTKAFFTEMYMLSQATYFVGTFNSNVGAFVAAFRRCHWQGGDNIGTVMNRYHHFFGSYGVDRENWFVRK